jgi:Asp-tRNA(Asn)/Glu-tRNA(Gln) amidotransferase A subunit family amidase
LISFAPSLDTIGVMANYVDDIKIVFDNIVGFDPKDQTTLIQKNFFLTSSYEKDVKKLKVAVFKE